MAKRKRFLPLGNNVLVKLMLPDSSSGGILLPDTAKQEKNMGRVAEVGNTVRDLEVGMVVLLPPFGAGAHTIHIDGVKHYMLSEDDVIAILEA